MARERKTRSYNSPLRENQVALTRTRILTAAYEMFLANGYAGTTVEGLAQAAQVSVQTIYNIVGPKPAVLKAVYDMALVGDEDPIPLSERPAIQAMMAEPDPRRVVVRYAHLSREIAGRTGQLALLMLAQANAGDADLRAFAATIDNERLIGTSGVAHLLAERSALRPGLNPERAGDVLWTLISPQVYDMLVNLRKWSLDEYEAWLASTIADALLGPELAKRRRPVA